MIILSIDVLIFNLGEESLSSENPLMIFDRDLYSIYAADVFCLLLAIPCLVFFAPLTQLAVLHLRNWWKGTTTYERYHQGGKE